MSRSRAEKPVTAAARPVTLGAADRAKDYSPQHLRAFVTVARRVRAGDRAAFRLAAEELFLTQPAVTLAVQALADALGGARLFEPHGRTVRLTAAGEALYESAEDLLVRWRGLRDVAEAATGATPRGTLRLGAGEAAVLYVLPPVVEAFRRRWPEVDLVLRQQTREESFAALERGDLDFAFRAVTATPAALDFERLIESPRVVIAQRAHPLARTRRVSVAQLLDQPFVMPWVASNTRRHIEEKLGRPPRIALEAGRWESIKRYVAIGLGIAVVPRISLQADDRRRLAELRVGRLFDTESYGVVTRAERTPRAAHVEFVRLLRASAETSRRDAGSRRGA